MGIPSFFRNIIEKYPNVNYWDPDIVTDHFLIDFNSIIYNIYAGLDKQFIKNLTTLQTEKHLILEIIKYLQHIICDICKPQKTIFFAFDGPVPMAKMIQQRWRRYKSIVFDQFKNNTANKLNIDIDKSKFNTISISPGTSFMKKLADYIKKYTEMGAFFKHIKNKTFPTVILSDSNVPGEGEHKYMNIIRNLNRNDIKDNITLLSPDADVIVLAIFSSTDKIRVLKEVNEPNLKEKFPNQEFIYTDIDLFKKSLFEQIIPVSNSNDFNMNRVLNDFSFLTFIGGNDFVPGPQFLLFRNNSLELILNSYIKILKKFKNYLIDNQSNGNILINIEFFIEFLDDIALFELNKQKEIQKKIHRIRKGNNPKIIEQYSKLMANDQLNDLDKQLQIFQHMEFYTPYHPFYEKYNHHFDAIDYFKDDWKIQFYSYFLNIDSNNTSEINNMIDILSNKYCEALLFTSIYYTSNVPSWNWHYGFRVAPFPSDLSNYLKRNKDTFKNIIFNLGQPFKPFEQLMMILPPSSSSLLPKPLSKFMNESDSEIIDMFPTGFELDVVIGSKYIYSEPVLPDIDFTKIIFIVNNNLHLLNKSELIRNSIKESPEVFIIKKIKKIKNIKNINDDNILENNSNKN